MNKKPRGRPALDGSKRVNIMLDAETVAIIATYKSHSAAIREAIRRMGPKP